MRTVAVPMVLVPELRAHLEMFTGPQPTASVFVGEKGATPRATNLRDGLAEGTQDDRA